MQYNKITTAVVDFGTFYMKAALAEKEGDGKMLLSYYAEVPSDGCIHRGIIYNMEIAAQKLQELLRQLETLSGKKIARLYVNVGGQSLRTIKHVESLTFDTPHEITEEDIERLLAQVGNFTHPRYEMLQIDSPEYFVNSNNTHNPVGVQALRLEARYQLIVARAQMSDNVEKVVTQKLNLDIASQLIAPIVLGNTFLTDDQKKLGCALIDFGSGSTTVSAYRNGLLIGIRVIPLGASNITTDLTSLHITEGEAERIKCLSASAISDSSDKSTIEVNAADKLSTKQLQRYDVCRYVEARTQEILDNVKQQLGMLIRKEDIGGGIVITGGGSDLKGLAEKLQELLKMNVEFAKALVPYDQTNQAYIKQSRLHLLYAMACHASVDCLVPAPVVIPLQPQPAEITEELRPETSDAVEETEQLQQQEMRYPEDEILREQPTQASLFGEQEIPVVTPPKKERHKTDPEVIKRKKSLFGGLRQKMSQGMKGFLEAVAPDMSDDI